MHVLVVGSISLDTVITPRGRVTDVIGGSSIYVSHSCRYYAPVRLVGVVGTDFPSTELEYLKTQQVDLTGLEILPGQTFRWGGKYHQNMNLRETLFTELNVFQKFNPVLPQSYQSSPYIFLANIQPDLQMNVLNQVRAPKFVAMDTMNFWISGMLPELKKILRHVDLLTVNDQEVQELSGETNLLKGAKKIMEMGPKALIIKRGEYGAGLVTHDSAFWVPAFPVADVVDPTGAGDTFAGGFMGYLARTDDLSPMNMRRAILHGTALASFCVEDFSINRLKTLTYADIQQRVQQLHGMIKCDAGL